MESAFRQVDGITATVVGFAGGRVKSPTYKQVCTTDTGHAEVIRVEYDPKKVSYERLLEVFWGIHDPTQFNGQGVNIGNQYRSVIFFHTPEQAKAARKSYDVVAKKEGQELATQIVEAVPFFMAEDYHQQYYNRKGVPACPIPPKSGGG